MSEYEYDLYEKHKDEIELRLKTVIVNVDNPKLMTWTPTAIELWDDKKFIEKRIKEQGKYKYELEKRFDIPQERKAELNIYCKLIYDRFVKRLKELNSDVAELVQAPH